MRRSAGIAIFWLLVRRLLENGANSSFVSVAADPAVPVSQILQPAAAWIAASKSGAPPRIPLPGDLYGASRKNSSGVEFGDRASLAACLSEVRGAAHASRALPLIDGVARPGKRRAVASPIDRCGCWHVTEGDAALARPRWRGAERLSSMGR